MMMQMWFLVFCFRGSRGRCITLRKKQSPGTQAKSQEVPLHQRGLSSALASACYKDWHIDSVMGMHVRCYENTSSTQHARSATPRLICEARPLPWEDELMALSSLAFDNNIQALGQHVGMASEAPDLELTFRAALQLKVWCSHLRASGCSLATYNSRA